LIPVTLWEGHNDSIFDIATKTNDYVKKSKSNTNKDHNEVTKIFTILPTYLLGFLTAVMSYLSQNCGISIKALSVSYNRLLMSLIVERRCLGTHGVNKHRNLEARVGFCSHSLPYSLYVGGLLRTD
jgi:hypothetical protein